MKHLAVLLICCSVCSLPGIAQLKNIGDKISFGKKGGSGLFKGKLPVSTSWDDVETEDLLPASFGNDATYTCLFQMPQYEDGGYILTPGYYEMTNMSFCLKAGAHALSTGNGYLYAPTKGSMEDVVDALLKGFNADMLKRNAANNGTAATLLTVPQHDMQQLLWAIIAKANYKSFPKKLTAIAVKYLNAEQLLKLSGIGSVAKNTLIKEITGGSPALQSVMEAESGIRDLVDRGSDSFEDFERVAVLTGVLPDISGPNTERGLWSKISDKGPFGEQTYYVRYFPLGYQQTQVQIYVPEKESRVVYNTVGDIAVPANTGAQRLAQTNVPVAKCTGKIGHY